MRATVGQTYKYIANPVSYKNVVSDLGLGGDLPGVFAP